MDNAHLITLPAPIPLESELEERLAFFIRLRWLAAAGILIGAWMLEHVLEDGFSPWPLVVIGVGVLAYNSLFALWRPSVTPAAPGPGLRIYPQMALDWVALTGLVHYTGGVQSPVALGHVFHIIIGALLLPRIASWTQAGIASALVGGLTFVENMGWWAPVDMGDFGIHAYGSGTAPALRWAVLSCLFAVVAFLTQSIASTLRRKERDLVDSQTHLDRAFREMQALNELGRAVHSTLDPEEVLRLIAERAAVLMGTKGCSIGLLDKAGTGVLPAATYGLSAAYIAKGPVEVERSAMIARALAGEVVQIQDTAGDHRLQYPERARQEGIGAIICVALQLRDRPIGVIRIYASTPRPFSGPEITFLRNIANLAAVAIASARAYAESLALSDARAWFARTTHHQLRAPLAVIASLLEAIPFVGELMPEQANLLDRIRRRTDEMLRLVRDLLELAHAQRPSLHLQPQPVVLADSLVSVLETQRERAGIKGVTLQIDDLSTAVVDAESDDVGRIFSNLLDNAVKYTPVGGTVSLQVRRRSDRVCVEVADTGIGIADTDRERVLRGFYRTDAARATGEVGSGIGLSIVQQLVQRWHGTLELDSTPGEGSCFRVLLPTPNGDGPTK